MRSASSVLAYDDSLRARGRAVLPVLYLEREPSDARWVALAERHHVRLIWPGTEHVLFQERSPASVTAGADADATVSGRGRPPSR